MFSWFRRKPHRLYGALYVIAIPVFACLYSRRASDFYEPNLVAEAGVSHLQKQIEEELGKPIGLFYKFTQKDSFPGVEKFEVSGLACNSRGLTFATPLQSAPIPKSFSNSSFRPIWTLDLPALEGNGGYKRRVSLYIEKLPSFVVYALSERHDVHPGEHYAWGDVRMATFEPDEKSVAPTQELFPGLLVGYLDIRPDLYHDIEEYTSACHGLPSEVKGGFWRFLYFSAVTITTLGLGDIIPVTTSARFLVAVEAVLGIVLAGFFVSTALQGKRG